MTKTKKETQTETKSCEHNYVWGKNGVGYHSHDGGLPLRRKYVGVVCTKCGDVQYKRGDVVME